MALVVVVIVVGVALAAGWYESCARLRHHLHQRIRYFLLSNTMSVYYMNRIDIGILFVQTIKLIFSLSPHLLPLARKWNNVAGVAVHGN